MVIEWVVSASFFVRNNATDVEAINHITSCHEVGQSVMKPLIIGITSFLINASRPITMRVGTCMQCSFSDEQ
jgi:hypothetical protein